MSTAADIRNWLFEEFASRLANVFEMMAGERPRTDIEPIAEMPADAGLCWSQSFSGVPGSVWIAASEQGWSVAGGHVLRAAGIEQSDPASLKSTYLETVSQALSGLGGAIGGRLGREVTPSSGEEISAQQIEASWATIRLKLNSETANITIGLEAGFIAVLVAASQPEISIPQPQQATAAAASTGASSGIQGHENSKTFDLLLDVELPVSVSFGRAQVPLKDVLKLTTGSIVELNRSILEPVEVIVNNCVIARGEVVVVEGNFGVRVHQVISRQERLRTLN